MVQQAYTYIKTTEIAKQVKKDLKAEFPKVKFYVRSTFDAIYVEWVDGSTTDEVKKLALKYSGRDDYDANYCDYQKNNPVEFQGKTVQTYLTYVFTNRHYSTKYLREVLEYVKSNYAGAIDDDVKIIGDSDGAYFDCMDYETLEKYREIARKCNSFKPIALQMLNPVENNVSCKSTQ